MTKAELLNYFDNKITYETLIRIIFYVEKYFDREFVRFLHDYQKRWGRVLDRTERSKLLEYFYYENKDLLNELNITEFPTITFNKNDETDVLKDFEKRLQEYESDKIKRSILKRYEDLNKKTNSEDNSKKWLEYYHEKQKESKYSGFLLKIDSKLFAENEFKDDFIYSCINKVYENLENYRYFFIEVNDIIKDQNNNDITWSVVNKVIVYAENFKLYTERYFPFKKESKIDELKNFIENRFPGVEAEKIAKGYYAGISTGFKYEDCLISKNSKHILLIFRKVVLDTRPIPCPSCMTTIQSGNSYPEIFLKSYECKNPDCPERSKSGRGKRFDDYGVYRYFKLVEHNKNDEISNELYEKWSRDIFEDDNDLYEMILSYYLWEGETLKTIGDPQVKCKTKGRKVEQIKDCNEYFNSEHVPFGSLPVVKLFIEIKSLLKPGSQSLLLTDDIEVINGDSTDEIAKLSRNQIGAAVTSPPYYNAREYSSWPNFVLYLIDMMRNGYSVYNALDDKGTYLYNVGDIVGSDNVFIDSNMSTRRIPLGAYTSLIFETIGFKIVGNIIWDKGQVQSKRHSTINLYSGYVGFVNCYEHILVCKKEETPDVIHSKVKSFHPVIKINCKGENTYKHTAPYPPELVECIKPYIIENKYVLDPFLGSGTTLVWCKQNGIKGVGYELNKSYYDLAVENIFLKII